MAQPHSPLLHACPLGQAVPQAPQFIRSVLMSTQPPEHSVSPPVQESLQAPSEHTCPAGHTVPHAPQLATSLPVSMQVPPHAARPAWHPHTPALQVVPAGHALPQLPQLELLVSNETQLVPHGICPTSHPDAPPVVLVLGATPVVLFAAALVKLPAPVPELAGRPPVPGSSLQAPAASNRQRSASAYRFAAKKVMKSPVEREGGSPRTPRL